MIHISKVSTYVADFETSVYDGQDCTEVWAAAIVKLDTEDVKVFNSIDKFYNYCCTLEKHIIVYFHNVKFDGSFLLWYFLHDRHFKNALTEEYNGENNPEFLRKKDMEPCTISYLISSKNIWYNIVVKTETGHLIEFRDSFKLLPFSVKRIGQSFGTKHKKTSIEYVGERHANGTITEQEEEYIKNDVLVVKEAIEIMYDEGYKKTTIGSCCLAEYKNIVSKQMFDYMFPNMYDIELSTQKYGSPTAGDYIRKSYKGGWCYLVPEKANTIFTSGITADVNSLYPSVMSGESKNLYPTGEPHFWSGDYIPDICETPPKDYGNHVEGIFWFIRIKTRFYLKPNRLPCIQIKGDFRYNPTDWLTTSDVYNPKTGKYCEYYKDYKGVVHKSTVTLTLTMTDYLLIKEQYDLIDCVILDGCWFKAESGIFDNYIEKYKKIKTTSTGALRELAKLFLNNLYGKFATSKDSSFKIAFLTEDDVLGYVSVFEQHKIPGYIPVGTAVTSYARNFTIRIAQQNYYGSHEPGFIYADTDSIHCDLAPTELKGVKVHPTNFLCWKLESTWDNAIFVRQKTYIEHIYQSDLKPVEPYYNVRCAGMGQRSKELFLKSINPDFDIDKLTDEEKAKYTKEELDFLSVKRTLSDFKVGLTVPGQLKARNIKGGTLLVEQSYKMTARR